MVKSVLVAAVVLGSAAASGNSSGELPKSIFNETAERRAERLSWWRHDRFGMFIHFGLYAMPARHEWVRCYEYIPNETYDKKYFPRFNPDLFDAREWAQAAKKAGMKYIVLTTKHHEGFCMWDSKVTDYKITNTPFGRDLVKEYVEACRAEGLKVGFYYSIIDWHHPHFTIDVNHPLRPRGGFTDESYARLNKGRDMAKYREYMFAQVRELLTWYGKIDIIWFDYTVKDKEFVLIRNRSTNFSILRRAESMIEHFNDRAPSYEFTILYSHVDGAEVVNTPTEALSLLPFSLFHQYGFKN